MVGAFPRPSAVGRPVILPRSRMASDDLEEKLHYRFADWRLLRRALVHKSYRNENPVLDDDNERLEFLGDAALSLIVGHLLMGMRPDASEGDLTRMRAAVVNEAALARVAEGLALGESLLLGRGEELTGGRRKPSLLADACEAVIGAVYLDGGYPAAHALCASLLADPIAHAVETLARDGDAKTRLQEWTQARWREPPSYAVTSQEGPEHALTFEVVLSVAGRELARGRGRSKKEAEQAAAQMALVRLRQEEGAAG